MKKNILLSAIAALLLTGVTLNASEAKKNDAPQAVTKKAPSYYDFYSKPDTLTKKQLEDFHKEGLISKQQMIRDELKLATKGISKPADEITNALNATFKAMSLIKKNDLKSAETELTTATTLFKEAMQKNPAFKLIPVDINTILADHGITLDDAKAIKENALRMIKGNQPQEAIALLSQLINQITITTTVLDMGLYPKATQAALDALKKGGKPETVLPMLIEGLNTMIVTEILIPIPVLVAQTAVNDAAKFDKSKKEEVAKLLTLAQKQLELAQLEGYLTKYDAQYKALSQEISSLQTKAKKEGVIAKDYDKIASSFKSLLEKIHVGTKKENKQ